MNLLKWSEPGFEDRFRALATASSLFDPEVEQRVRSIIDQVRLQGDQALVEMTERWDGAQLPIERLALTKAEYLAAGLKAEPALRKAVALAGKNIAAFSRRSLRRNWSGSNAQGAKVGEKFDPFQRVGIYIPGGTAPLVSTALMTVTLARVAGCPEIVVCTPCNRSGQVDAALLYAVRAAGATEVYRVGGAQAIAAMALGTGTIGRVHKVFGPGNAYVVAAKRLLVGHVAIDLLPGPSEVLVLADNSASPAFIAADLLAQAEHGSGHERVWLMTTSLPMLRAVQKEVERQLPLLSRSQFIEKALKHNGWLIHVRSMDEAIRLTNFLAPEHCEIMARQSDKIAARIVTAGAVFLGDYSPTVLGDYVAGPSHTLPTGGAGVSFGGLTVDQFQRRTSVVRYDQKALKRSLDAVQTFARMEGLDAHGQSAQIRLENRTGKGKKRGKR